MLKRIFFRCVILASVLMLVIGCANLDASSENRNKSEIPSTSNENGKGSNVEKESVKTIRTYLKLELTGPNKELKQALDKWDSGDPSLLNAYDKKYYQPLFGNGKLQDFINNFYVLQWLMDAYLGDYQLKPTSIEVKKNKNDDYDCKAKVEYTKDGKTNTSTVSGLINTNDNGKIIWIELGDVELSNALGPDSKGKTK